MEPVVPQGKACHRGLRPAVMQARGCCQGGTRLPPQGAHSARVVTLPSGPEGQGLGSRKLVTAWKDGSKAPQATWCRGPCRDLAGSGGRPLPSRSIAGHGT